MVALETYHGASERSLYEYLTSSHQDPAGKPDVYSIYTNVKTVQFPYHILLQHL
jgi:hypothetical protein